MKGSVRPAGEDDSAKRKMGCQVGERTEIAAAGEIVECCVFSILVSPETIFDSFVGVPQGPAQN